MSLKKDVDEFKKLWSDVGNILYQYDGSGYYSINVISVYDTKENLYTFFKELAIHFKNLKDEEVPEEEDDF